MRKSDNALIRLTILTIDGQNITDEVYKLGLQLAGEVFGDGTAFGLVILKFDLDEFMAVQGLVSRLEHLGAQTMLAEHNHRFAAVGQLFEVTALESL